jgi:hypothetical protein
MRLPRRLDEPLHRVLQHEKDGREEDQERNQPVEHSGRRHLQENCADDAAGEARHNERVGGAGQPAQVVTIAPQSSERSGPDGDRTRRIRERRRQPDPDERGKGDESAAAGNRIYRAGNEGGQEDDKEAHDESSTFIRPKARRLSPVP